VAIHPKFLLDCFGASLLAMTSKNGTAASETAQRKADLHRSFVASTREGLVAMPIVTMALPVDGGTTA